MTIGNDAAVATRPSTRTAERLVEATLALIAEKGGSHEVNLRAVSRRVGCAHTNVYNYFDSYADLRWEAFRRALRIYGAHLTKDLDASLPARDYLRRAIENLASFPQEEPGLYRFIGSDPIDLETIPVDIIETVTAMKRWLAAAVDAAARPGVTRAATRDAADIVLAYIDGETLNLINGRAIPDEDLGGRVVANALRLFDLLVGSEKRRRAAPPVKGAPPEPGSIFSVDEGAAS